MTGQSSPAVFKTLTGYILSERDDDQSNQDDDPESENEEEERQPEFLDMSEMDSVSSGGRIFKSCAPASKEVNFQVGKKIYRVVGCFPLHDPWWEISCTVRQGQRKSHIKGYPYYSLRTNLGSAGQSLVSLFLTACGAEPLFVHRFMEWLPKDRYVEPVNVLDALQDFEESSLEHKALAEQLKTNVNYSDPGTHVRIANMYPEVMKYLPTLLPGQFMDIINKGKMEQNNTEVLAKLDELIKTKDVWKLGFNFIMFKEFHLIRCEAKVEAFQICDLFRSIPVLQRNALLLYTKLKEYCRATGSTYIEQEKLVEWMRREIGVEDVWKAVHFLEEQGVLIREKRKVALRNLFFYEKGIAECLRCLVEAKPWKIHLDVSEILRRAQLERLKVKACEQDDMTQLRKPHADTRTSASAHNDLEQGVGSEQRDLAFNQTSTSSIEESVSPNKESSSTAYMDPDLSTEELDPDHVRAAEMMCSNAVTVISGKGGCGKTTVVSLVFKAAMQRQTSFSENAPVEVLLTAPTGRAASLLTKRTSFTAYTMHQVLWSFMNAKKDGLGNPEDWKFSHVQVLVVDEGSLVSVQILHSILNMLTKHAQLQKFIILGDVRQLPSIEPGNTLCDLFQGLRDIRFAIEMQTNHRAESEFIVRNAGLISEMGKKRRYSPLEFDATIDMTRSFKVPSSDKRFIFVQISRENYDYDLQNAIKFLLEKAPGLENDRSSQFVAFTRKICQLLNELCCKHYSDHITKTHKYKLNFQVGDKVCCTKNGYISDKDDENKEETFSYTAEAANDDAESQRQKEKKKERLCNGEIFFIKEDVTEEDMGATRKKNRYLTLDDENGRLVTSSYRQLQRECKLRHAWARTIHTFQGSEAETIVYVHGYSKAQNWQHLYTAVTRGIKRVYVVGTEADIEKSIQKQVIHRNTRLCSLIRSIAARPRDDYLTQSGNSPGFWPSQSTPLALHTPSFSQAFSGPSHVRRLYREEDEQNLETSQISLQDEIALGKRNACSSMENCDEPIMMQNEDVSELYNHVGDAALSGATSSSPKESSRASKRLAHSDTCSTPSKKLK